MDLNLVIMAGVVYVFTMVVDCFYFEPESWFGGFEDLNIFWKHFWFAVICGFPGLNVIFLVLTLFGLAVKTDLNEKGK